MPSGLDAAFVRRAVGKGDLNAVRLALCQITRDPELLDLPPVPALDEAGRALIVEKAVTWLVENAGPRKLPEPPPGELRRLMELAAGETVSDVEFDFRREIPAFNDHPWATLWDGQRPSIPPGFTVAVVGAGFSGVAMAIQLELLQIPYVVLEKQSEIGGTWSRNRYPDVRVDTVSLGYEFSFEKDYRWSEYFARGEEVRRYLQLVADKYGVTENVRFDTEVEAAEFDDQSSTWRLAIRSPEGRDTVTANVLVTGMGTFANAKLPDFESQEDFRGEIVVPSRWPDELDLEGSRVAVVGNGSTGVQLLAPIAAKAEHVTVFQRTPQWIAPRPLYGTPIDSEVHWLSDNLPGYWNWQRYIHNSALFGAYDLMLNDEEWAAGGGLVNPKNDKLRDDLLAYIRHQTGGREDLIEKLVPDYAPFARRPVVDNGWYEALTRPHVSLVTDSITGLHRDGIRTADGRLHDVDVIVAALGFEVVKYLEPAVFTGRGGKDLHEVWERDGPRAYLGMMVPDFPNMFMLYGPNAQSLPSGHQLPAMFVIWASYIGQCITTMLTEQKSRVEVTEEAFGAYNQRLDAQAAKLIFMDKRGAPDKNYYVNQQHGRLQVNAPWWGPDFHRMCSRVDWDDLHLA